jgi:hypothetical protein
MLATLNVREIFVEGLYELIKEKRTRTGAWLKQQSACLACLTWGPKFNPQNHQEKEKKKERRKKETAGLDIMAHTSNPSYLEGGDQEDSSWGQPRQIFCKTPISTNKLGKCWWKGSSDSVCLEDTAAVKSLQSSIRKTSRAHDFSEATCNNY